MTNGIGELYFATLSEAGGDNIFGYPTPHVGGAAVDLARILAGEGPAAMPAPAAITVDDDLSSGQAGVSFGAANDETPGGVDQELGLVAQR